MPNPNHNHNPNPGTLRVWSAGGHAADEVGGGGGKEQAEQAEQQGGSVYDPRLLSVMYARPVEQVSACVCVFVFVRDTLPALLNVYVRVHG